MYLHQFQHIASQKHPIKYSKDVEQLKLNLKNDPHHLHVILTRQHYSLFVEADDELCQIDSLGVQSPIKVEGTNIILSLSITSIHCAKFLLIFIKELGKNDKISVNSLNSSLRDVCSRLRRHS